MLKRVSVNGEMFMSNVEIFFKDHYCKNDFSSAFKVFETNAIEIKTINKCSQ